MGGLAYPNEPLPYPINLFGVECNDGWLELISELINKLIETGWNRDIKQIKEKFGGLRFHAGGLKNGMSKIIREYESRSYTICETCGGQQNVKLRGTSWVKTLCDDCSVPWLERQNRLRQPPNNKNTT